MRLILLVLCVTLSSAALAQHSGHGTGLSPAWSNSGTARARSLDEKPLFFDGEVRAVDKSSASVTLIHESVPILDMPAATMTHTVKDAAILDRLNPGDRVRFTAVLQGRAVVITRICTGGSRTC